MNDHQKSTTKASAGDGQPKSPTRMHYTHLGEAAAVCPSCRRQFQPRRHWQRYCSDRCRTLGHKRGNTGSLHKRVQEIERRLELLEGLFNARPAPGVRVEADDAE